MQFEEAGRYLISLLNKELPGNLCYHNVEHTLDVYHAAEHIAKTERVADKDMKLLLTAAWFHDSGHIKGRPDHEKISCAIARESLPQFGYTPEDIEQICDIIMATRIPQTPTNYLGEILADADLDYLGRDDFFEISEKLYQEFCATGHIESKKHWNQVQVEFFAEHHYFTKTARSERQTKKEHNLQLIKAELK
jgi:uncharacterized protein